MKTVLLSAAVALAALSATSASAATVGILGGQTDVTVTADLAGFGLSGAPAGTATVSVVGGLPVFSFPITGGTAFSDGNALVEHDGSGVTLAAGSVAVTVGNFLIDTASMIVSGDIFGGPTGVTFFEFGDETALPGVELEISAVLAGALTSTFGAPDLTGATFGYAVPSPELAPVPLPASLPLLAAGVLGLVALRRRAQAS